MNNPAKLNGLVIINGINSIITIGLARKFNESMHPLLLISSDQKILDSIDFKHPEIVASVIGNPLDDQLVLDALSEVEPVFGKLERLILTSGLMDESPHFKEYVDETLISEMANYVSAVAAVGFILRFSSPKMSGVSLTSVTNVIENIDATNGLDQVSLNKIFNNYEIINVNPINDDSNTVEEVRIHPSTLESIAGKAPYSYESLTGIISFMSGLEKQDYVRLARVEADENQPKIVNPSFQEIVDVIRHREDNINNQNFAPAPTESQNIPDAFAQAGQLTEVTVQNTDSIISNYNKEGSLVMDDPYSQSSLNSTDPLTEDVKAKNTSEGAAPRATFAGGEPVATFNLSRVDKENKSKDENENNLDAQYRLKKEEIDKIPSEVEELNKRVSDFSNYVERMTRQQRLNDDLN